LAFGALTTSISVATDLEKGIVDRIKSLPIANWALLMGHVVADLARNIIQSVILIGIGLVVGFRPTASFFEWLIIIGVVLLFTFAISWLSAILGLLAKSLETVQWMGFLLIFPLTFASAAFVPTETMPRFLKAFAENQPITHVIEAIRALMNGLPTGNHVWISAIWCIVIIVFSIPTAAFLYRRHSGR
jgi:ABC-2 type transport system permease protein